jgi:cbb3-type cytochrome c oxidase subunit III
MNSASAFQGAVIERDNALRISKATALSSIVNRETLRLSVASIVFRLAVLTLVTVVSLGAGSRVCAAADNIALLERAPTDDILGIPELRSVAMSLGRSVYLGHCARCHGVALRGSAVNHAPDLTDNVWLFSGDDPSTDGVVIVPSDIEKTVRYGIRAGDDRTRAFRISMPGQDQLHFLNAEQIADVTEYVLSLSSQAHDAEASRRGRKLFQTVGICYDCHGIDATGSGAIGAPDLTKGLFLYGGWRSAIRNTITYGLKGGVCPAFQGILGEAEIKSVAVFVMASSAAQARPPDAPRLCANVSEADRSHRSNQDAEDGPQATGPCVSGHSSATLNSKAGSH